MKTSYLLKIATEDKRKNSSSKKEVVDVNTFRTVARGLPQMVTHSLLSPYTLVVPEVGGMVRGAIDDKVTFDDIIEWSKENKKEYLPGVGPYRLAAKSKALENTFAKSPKSRKTLSEYIADFVPFAIGATGGAIGGTIYANRKYGDTSLDNLNKKILVGTGGTLGAMLATLVPMGIGGLAGYLLGKRNKKQLEDYYNSKYSVPLNYLVPGVSDYNAMRNVLTADDMIKQYQEDKKFRAEIQRLLADKKKGIVLK